MENKDIKQKLTLRTILNGKFLESERLQRNWPFIIYLSFLSLIMIGSSHQAEKKVYTIASLTEELKKVSAFHVKLRSELMQKTLETNIEEEANKANLIKGKTPPIKIRVSQKEFNEAE